MATMRDVDTATEAVEMAEKVKTDALEFSRRSDLSEPTREKAREVHDLANDLARRGEVLKDAVVAEASR